MNPRWRALIGALVVLVVGALVAPNGAQAGAPGKPLPQPEKLIWGDLAPAFPGDIVVKQPDGSTFKAKLTNAEIGGDLEVGGHTVTKRQDGWWVYAAGREGGRLTETGSRAGLDAVPAGLALGVGRTESVWSNGAGGDLRSQALRQLQIASLKAQQAAAEDGGPRVFRFPVLMLATWWDEEQGQTEPQFQEGNTAEAFKKVLDGFGGNDTGTLTEFWFENSHGQFLVQVDVYGPYVSQRSRQDRCYYGGIDPSTDPADDLDPTDSALGIGGGGAIGMAAEAVPQADADVDFSQYDNDEDGFVDFTAVLHSGPDMAATGDPCHTWSHAIEAGLAGPVVEETIGLPHGSLEHGIPTTDGVVVNRLFTMPEIDLEIGVATHEMAHALGEPDYYNPSYTSAGTGDWDIMAGGSWFGNPPGSNPTWSNPATRVFQGWVQPRIVKGDVKDLSLAPRELKPAGYTAEQPHPNVVLVPTKTVKVGDVTEDDHTWTEDDVYGLPKDGDRYVIEGYYLENISRSVTAAPFDKRMKRQPYFDRQALSSGLMVWHFDYYRRSNVYYGSNDAGSDPNRPQMDPVEFDFNDNSQELQLGTTRGEPQDLVVGAATGITSGTRQLPPGIPDIKGTPQEEIAIQGVTTPATPGEAPFTVEANPANYQMRVSVAGLGDCKLQVFTADGKPVSGEVDSGFVAAEEFVDVVQPKPGDYVARVADFAACGPWSGTVTFSTPAQVFNTKGAGDTWSNWTQKPTGWAFTNVRPNEAERYESALDAGNGVLTLDVLQMTGSLDLSPGFISQSDVDAGRANRLTVPIFNNGDKASGPAEIVVRRGKSVVARGTLPNLPGYARTVFSFDYRPAAEGPFDLVVEVDPGRRIPEKSDSNNVQRTVLEASPAGGHVLVIDDDGAHDGEDTVTGALASIGLPYDVVTGTADVATMKRYQAVVWESGLERYQGQLDPTDRKNIQAYLDGGGKVLFASPRAAAALGEPAGGTNPLSTEDMVPFLADHFGVKWIDTQQVGGGTVTGTGDFLGKDAFAMDVFPGRPLQDVWGAAESKKGKVVPVASWDKGGEDSLMAVRVEGKNGFKTVFLGFNPAQLVNGADAASVLQRALGWLGANPGGYRAPGAPVIRHSAIRNAVSGRPLVVKAFTTGLRTGAPVLTFRQHGAAKLFQVTMTQTRAGVWQATIPGQYVKTVGVDYIITAGSARDPITVDLPHYVAVGLPL